MEEGLPAPLTRSLQSFCLRWSDFSFFLCYVWRSEVGGSAAEGASTRLFYSKSSQEPSVQSLAGPLAEGGKVTSPFRCLLDAGLRSRYWAHSMD